MQRAARGLPAILAIAALAAPAPAHADGATVLMRDTRQVAQPYQGWLDASRVPTTDAQIWLVFREPACGVAECSDPVAREIFMYRGVDHLTVYDFMHEVGHIVDHLALDAGERAVWKRFVGRAHTGWWQGDEAAGEQWAQAYALCSQLRVLRGRTPYPGYGWDPTPRRHRAACRLVRRLAAHE